MAKLHPLTKALIAVAVVAVPYLLWTAPEPGPAAAVNARDDAALMPPATAPSLVIPTLPSLPSFAATVDRPLFAPSRRMPPEAVPEPTIDLAEAAPLETGPDEPVIRFFGTMTRRGQTLALAAIDGEQGPGRKLALDDEVGEWRVVAIERDRLVLGRGDERRDYTILRGGVPLGGAEPDPGPFDSDLNTESDLDEADFDQPLSGDEGQQP